MIKYSSPGVGRGVGASVGVGEVPFTSGCAVAFGDAAGVGCPVSIGDGEAPAVGVAWLWFPPAAPVSPLTALGFDDRKKIAPAITMTSAAAAARTIAACPR